jgi:hypothetical protein
LEPLQNDTGQEFLTADYADFRRLQNMNPAMNQNFHPQMERDKTGIKESKSIFFNNLCKSLLRAFLKSTP